MHIDLIETECKVIIPEVYSDKRGYFFESYNKEDLKYKHDIKTDFVQDNESFSRKNVLRGLHFQLPPFAQAKLVRVPYGKILDIVVDIRAGSSTFGDYCSIILSAKNKKQLFIPKGYAHGFVVLSEEARFCYKCDNHYNKNYERGIKWNDTDINIDWGIDPQKVIVSEKDKSLPLLKEAELPKI